MQVGQDESAPQLVMPAPSGVFASLRGNRPFRQLWFSNLFFFGGVWTQTLILGWLVYEQTHSDLLVAVFAAARLSPLLLGPLAGAFADRHNRVTLLIVACSWACTAVGGLAALVTFGLAPYWVMLAGGLAIGLAQSPSQPARASLVFDLVGPQNLSNANALNAIALNMTQVAGPAAGGLLIGLVGAPTALWISSAWYAVSLVMLLPLRGRGATAHASDSALKMITEGLRVLSRIRLAALLLLITVAANTFIWPIYQSFMPVFAKQNLGLGAAGLGWLLTCSGAGGVLGSLVIAGLGDFRFKGALFTIGTATWGTLWAVFALSHHAGVAFVLLFGVGLASAPFVVLQTTLLLMTTPPSIHGRVLGLQELAIGMQPLASLALGALAARFGVGPTASVSAASLVVMVVALVAWTPALVRYTGAPSRVPKPAERV